MLFSYGFKVWTIAAITADKDLQRRTLNNEGSPQRLVALQQTAREMACRCAMENETISTLVILVPVKFGYLFRWIIPVFQMLTDTERTDDMAYFRHQQLYILTAQMVVVIVRNDEVVYLRHIRGLIYVCSRECFSEDG